MFLIFTFFYVYRSFSRGTKNNISHIKITFPFNDILSYLEIIVCKFEKGYNRDIRQHWMVTKTRVSRSTLQKETGRFGVLA